MLIRARSSTHYQLLDEIPGPLHSLKRKNPVGLYRRSGGAKGLVRSTQSVWKTVQQSTESVYNSRSFIIQCD
jgi:hypothetical protein